MRAALRVLGEVLAPAALALLSYRCLVPRFGAAAHGVAAGAVHQHPLLFVGGLFLLFAGLARYWSARLLGERAGARATPSRPRVLGLLAAGVTGLAAALGVRAVARPYQVASGSMLPSFAPGDVVAGNTLATPARGEPSRRGDVIVFRSAAVALEGLEAPPDLVKRVIGLPGDRIEMHGSSPVINGWQAPSCDAGGYAIVQTEGAFRSLFGHLRVEFLDGRAYLTFVTAQPVPFTGPFVVPPGQVFVLGDNRANSADSRAWDQGRGGGVPFTAIAARVRWFLAGPHRNGEADLGRFLRPAGGLDGGLHAEGVDTRELETGIARCLAARPADSATTPPHDDVEASTNTTFR